MAPELEYAAINIQDDVATIRTVYGDIEVFRTVGMGEWSSELLALEVVSPGQPSLRSLGVRGEFIAEGKIDFEFPTEWAEDWREELDGPKVATLWQITVSGIPLELHGIPTEKLPLSVGTWVRAHISRLTYWWGEDEVAAYFRERESRTQIGAIVSHLQKLGCRSIRVSRDQQDPDMWVLSIRPKDFSAAAQVSASNL